MTKNRDRFYFNVGWPDLLSTRWYLWGHRSSFYFVNDALGQIKISLHGSDEDRGLKGRFHVRHERTTTIAHTGSSDLGVEVLLVEPKQGWPCVFTGSQVEGGLLAIRMRITERACAIGPRMRLPIKPNSVIASLVVPPQSWSQDIDIFFQQLPVGMLNTPIDKHYVEFSIGTTNVQVAVGEPPAGRPTGFMIRTQTGLVLKSRFHLRRFNEVPAPVELLGRPTKENDAPAHRQIAVGIDNDSVLWFVEDASHWHHARIEPT